MAQFLLVLMCGVVVFFAINTIINMTKAASASANTALGENMPKTFQRIAYVVLMVMAIGAVLNMAKSMQTSATHALGDNMPKTFQRIAYVVLILLMFGVVTGWLGAA